MSKKTLDIVLYIFIALIIAISAINFSLIANRSEKVNEAVRLAEKENQPAKIELIKVATSSCTNCFNIDPVIESLKKSNVNVTSEKNIDFSSEEAKRLISQYNIQKLPTVIVLGEVNKSTVTSLWNQNWQVEMKDGNQASAVYSAIKPPYMDANGTVEGLVLLKYIVDNSCPKCANFAQTITNFFKEKGVVFSSEETIEYNSSEAKELIAKFGVQKIPALIISKNILDYEAVAQIWGQLNATEKEGFYALHTTAPPYRDVSTNKILGLVSVIYINDSTCTDCYNVQTNKLILERNFGLTIVNETSIDISSGAGKSLLKQYNITKVPIMLASPEANVYVGFVQVWPQVGTVENDGWFVMRNPGVVGTYKDLSSGQIVSPQRQSGG